jgi:hypothetical protein
VSSAARDDGNRRVAFILQRVQLSQLRDLVKDLLRLVVALSGILLPLFAVGFIAYQAIKWIFREY